MALALPTEPATPRRAVPPQTPGAIGPAMLVQRTGDVVVAKCLRASPARCTLMHRHLEMLMRHADVLVACGGRLCVLRPRSVLCRVAVVPSSLVNAPCMRGFGRCEARELGKRGARSQWTSVWSREGVANCDRTFSRRARRVAAERWFRGWLAVCVDAWARVACMLADEWSLSVVEGGTGLRGGVPDRRGCAQVGSFGKTPSTKSKAGSIEWPAQSWTNPWRKLGWTGAADMAGDVVETWGCRAAAHVAATAAAVRPRCKPFFS